MSVMASDQSYRHDPALRAARLAQLRATGLVRSASESSPAMEGSLPVTAALRPLLPGAGLRKGSTVSVSTGATSLLFALIAEASATGSWCAIVGLSDIGLLAAQQAGVMLGRLALVTRPGTEWASVVATLLDGMDIVVVSTPTAVPAQVASRLTARARQRGAVLMPVGRWLGADLTIEVAASRWHGVGHGRGRLRRHDVEVVVRGRGVAAQERRTCLSFTQAATVTSSALAHRSRAGLAVVTDHEAVA